MSAPPQLTTLVERFERNLDAYRSGKYNETQVRRDFIDPLLKLLGWDVDNKKGYAEQYREVVHEDAVKVSGSTKAPDYSLRIGGQRKLFVEAKKPSVNIKQDLAPAFQVRRYAWSAKLPLSILTDFEEFAVYDCRDKPDKKDAASHARIMYLTFRDYAEKWDELVELFSPDAIMQGAFDKFVQSSKKKRGTAEVDDAFLAEISTWRDALARNIALRNPGIKTRDLNHAVQHTIDRLIFLRIAEDRGIEGYGRLRTTTTQPNIYAELGRLFQLADAKYNSGLFHFKPERGRDDASLDSFTLNLNIDDKVLRDIIKRLYYPDSPYQFDVIPADILGQVYEQFLGKVIRLTPKGQAKVEEKPEVKKAGGVFYTPTYIVDYIVQQTVGQLLDGKQPGPKGDASKLRILDPACGSGSFLLGAYQFLLDWHRSQYLNTPDKWARGKNPVIYQNDRGEWRLTIGERKRILLNNIYGVDIDPQAVEVTKLSLLLKVMEGENEQTLGSQLRLLPERVLPDLSSNIQCGNSLIGPDFYDGQQLSLGILDEEEMYRINVFDWAKAFPRIVPWGGFDAVIGNPPYVRQEMLGEFKPYFAKKYETYAGTADLYVYFVEKGVNLLKQNGRFAYIMANKWMRAKYGKPLRKWLQKQNLEQIIDFEDLPVFQNATTYPCILSIIKNSNTASFKATIVDSLAFNSLQNYIIDNQFEVDISKLNDEGWALASKETQTLLEKLFSQGQSLEKYVQKKVFYGLKTGLNKAFVIDEETKNQLVQAHSGSADLLKPFLVGRDIKRYQKLPQNKFLIFIPSGWTNSQINNKNIDGWTWFKTNYPAIADYLEQFKKDAQKRYDQGEYWWELRPCAYYDEFEKTKIIYAEIASRGQFTLDTNQFLSDTTSYILGSDSLYLLGTLNSKVWTFLFSKTSSTIRGGFFRWKKQYMFPLPIVTSAKPSLKEHIASHVEQMLELHKRLAAAQTAHEKTLLQRQIAATDSQIDQLVYQLYNLTPQEIAIVEGAT
ncbi:MAG: Eco57I restriction-modification methylase domain-containing protein [Anaerolineales bacterium]|nr:Eco57I restriction-modification methylase domain-containing protein [Anaerolineales bacterium]